jgi:hypothetical protein
MSRPPFIFSRETERAAIDRAVRDPVKRELLYAMVDAVLRVRETSTITPTEMAPIIAAFKAADEALWGRAARWLAKLHAFLPSVATTIEALSQDRDATVRWHLCASLNLFPADLAVPFLRRFLSDKSARVRSTVLTIAVVGDFRALLPDLESWLLLEKKTETREDINEAIALLRDGKHIRDGTEIRRLPDGQLEYIPL